MKLRQQYHFRESSEGLLAWDVSKLIRLSKDFEVIQQPLRDIKELKEPYWFGLGTPAVCEEIALHAKLICEADLSYPIILCPENRVMDGMHRVCKAFLEEQNSIPAVKFSVLHQPDHIGKQPDELSY